MYFCGKLEGFFFSKQNCHCASGLSFVDFIVNGMDIYITLKRIKSPSQNINYHQQVKA